jgi:hypothetical protein
LCVFDKKLVEMNQDGEDDTDDDDDQPDIAAVWRSERRVRLPEIPENTALADVYNLLLLLLLFYRFLKFFFFDIVYKWKKKSTSFECSIVYGTIVSYRVEWCRTICCCTTQWKYCFEINHCI